MKIKLTKPFASNGKADEFDTRQMKKALNRLGYYQPYEKTGITGIPDAEVFAALRKFQQDQNLPATGTAKPDDETVNALNSEAAKKSNGQYIWRTAQDDKVRASHAAFNGTVRDLADSPDPGKEFNCRCWAEFVSDMTSIPSVKQNCKAEELALEKAKEEFKKLDRKKESLENEIRNLEKEKARLTEKLKALLGSNIVPWLITLPLPAPHIVVNILQRFFSSFIGNKLTEETKIIGDEYTRVDKKLKYEQSQLALIMAQLSNATDKRAKALQKLKECQTKTRG